MLKSEMKILYIVLLSVALLVLAGGCGANGKKDTDPFGWPLTGDYRLDSMRTSLEYLYQSNITPDSLIAPTLKYLEKIRMSDGRRSSSSDSLFWSGRMLLRTGREQEGGERIRKAIEITDSVAEPYKYYRYKWTLRDYNAYSAGEALYKALVEDERFFREHNAPVLLAGTLSSLAWMMTDAGLYERAASYSVESDSIFDRLSKTSPEDDRMTVKLARISNRLNTANLHFINRDTVGAVTELRKLQAKEGKLPPALESLVDFNLWVMESDTLSLMKIRRMEESGTATGVGGITAAYILDIIMKGEGKRMVEDEEGLVADIEKGLSEEEELEHRAFMMRVLARYYRRCGDSSKENEYWERYSEEIEASCEDIRRGALASAETARQINDYEVLEAERRMMAKLRFVIVTAILILSAALIILILLRRLEKTKLEKEKKEEELRRSEQAELAANLLVAERNHFVETLEQQLLSLSTENKEIKAEASRIVSTLRADTSVKKESEEFVRLFRNLGFDFEKRLRERYPDVTKKSVRLASYIALGMDSRQISRVMNIKVESVSQARWRLRQQMGIGSDENMESILMGLLGEKE